MADISKINAVLLANIAEIDDVLAANIAKVNGLVFTTAPAFTGVLDTYTGAIGGYSVRRLLGGYTGACMRVREDSGDTETDIGFDSNGDLDTAAIATHCGSANGYVTKWYGQNASGGTGSGNDAEQTVNGAQPQIYNGTSVLTENGKPVLKTAAGVFLSTTLDDSIKMFSVASFDRTVVMFQFAAGITPSYLGWALLAQSGSTSTDIYDSTNITFNSLRKNASAYSLTSKTRGDLYTDWNAQHLMYADITTVGDDFNLGYKTTPSSFPMFSEQEVLIYPSTVTHTPADIETNINTYFQIGNFGTPTSGLLYDYSGAAAAYSVRQLANTAALAMRVREDGTDTETDIGFDSNGDLDTAAISSHCGSNNGYVVTWYDQAGSQNDATQGTSGSQPQIYDGTAVITENGKPSLDFDGSNDHFDISASLGITGSQARSTFFVLRPEATSSTSSYQTYFGLGDNTTLPNSQIWDLWPEWSVRLFGGFEKYNTATINAQYLSTNILSGTDVTDNAFFLDGTEQTATSSTSTTVNTDNTVQRIGRTGSNATTGPYYTGQMQEVVIWASAQTTNRSGIEANINNYFSIY